MAEPPLDLTEDMLVTSADDDSLRALATAASAHRPLPPSPPPVPGPKPVAPMFPPVKAPAYLHREVRVITTPSGGYGVIVGQELVGVAEGAGRLGTLIAEWAKGL